MTLPTFNPPMRPSTGTNHSPEVKLRTASFGDGYIQASPAGLNHIRGVVGFKWDFLTLEEARLIDAFFRSLAGNKPFLYTLNGETSPRQWTCETWSLVEGHPSRVTATFKENFVGIVAPPGLGAGVKMVTFTDKADFDAYSPASGELALLIGP